MENSGALAGGGAGGSSGAEQPIATKLMANNNASRINNTFFITLFDKYLS